MRRPKDTSCRFSRRARAVVLLWWLLMPFAAQAADCTFQPSSGIWHLAGNWNCGLIPTAENGDSALVDVGHAATISSALNLGNLSNLGTLEIAGTTVTMPGRLLGRSFELSSNDGTINVGTSSASGVLVLGRRLVQSANGALVVHDGSVLNLAGGIGSVAQDEFDNPLGGGTITTLGSGRVVVAPGASASLLFARLNGNLDLTGSGARLAVVGGLTLDGRIDIGGGAALQLRLLPQIHGAGSIAFVDDNAANTLIFEAGAPVRPDLDRFTIGSGISVRGKTGRFVAQSFLPQDFRQLVIDGAITADTAGGRFTFDFNGDIRANGELSARNGGTLDLKATGLITGVGTLGAFDGGTVIFRSAATSAPGSRIAAARGGTLLLDGGTLVNARVETDATSALRSSTLESNTFDGITLAGTLELATQPGRANVRNGITLDGGTAHVGPSSRLSFIGNQSIGGTGTILLSSNDALRNSPIQANIPPREYIVNANLTYTVAAPGEGLTIGAGTILRGAGRISDGSGVFGDPTDPRQQGRIVNHGQIVADVAGDTLHIFQIGNAFGRLLVNDGVLEARNGATLDIENYTIDNRGGLIRVGAGSRLLVRGAGGVDVPGLTAGGITGGDIVGESGALIEGSIVAPLRGTTLRGTLGIGERTLLAVDRATLAGTLEIGAGAGLVGLESGRILDGSGTIVFTGANTRSAIGFRPDDRLVVGDLQLGPQLTVRGVSGRISSRTRNLGTIVSDGGGTFTVDPAFALGSDQPSPFVNDGTARASNGALSVLATLAGVGRLQVDAAGVVTLANGGNRQGTLAMGARGAALDIGSGDLTLTNDYTNMGAGSGNSFDRRAGVSGAGRIVAGGDVAQRITGAAVANGDTASAVLTIGNVRVGTTAFEYRIANVGTSGPVLRGALQTNVNGGNISDARLGGTGVSAGDYTAGGPGSESGPLQVTFTARTSGTLAPLLGQAVNLRSNFENIADQKLNVVLAEGAGAYAVAAGSLQSAPLNFGTVQVGQTVSRELAVRNIGTGAAGFVEDLNVRLAGVDGIGHDLVQASGALSGILAGQTSAAGNGTLRVGVDTRAAGTVRSTVNLQYFSAGAVGGKSNGLGELLVGSEGYDVSGAITANVVERANPVLNTPSIDFGARRVGDAGATAFLSLANQAGTAPQAALNASIGGASSPFTASGSIALLAPGGSDASSLQVGMGTATAGSFAGSATIALVSDASNVGNCAPMCALELDSRLVALQGRVYGRAQAELAGSQRIDFGVVRVGDAANVGRMLANVGEGALVDALRGTVGALAAPFSLAAPGLIDGIAAGGATELSFALDTHSAGVFGGTTSIALASHNDELADLDLGTLDLQLTGTVNNLAAPELVQTQGDGTFARQSDWLYAWDFGEVSELSDIVLSATFAIGNTAAGPADDLAGSFRTSGANGFALSGFDAFAGLAPGARRDGLTVTFDTARFRRGVIAASIFLDPRSVFAGLDDVSLAPIELRLSGRISGDGVGVPAPRAEPLLVFAVIGVIALRTLRRRVF